MSSTTFRIGTLMGAIAIIAVVLALVLRAPGIAALLAIPAIFASIRTLSTTRFRDGTHSSLGYFLIFLRSFATICLIIVASIAAFFGTCLAVATILPGSNRDTAIIIGVIMGVVAAIGVAVGLSMAAIAIARDLLSRRGRKHSDQP